MITQSYLQTGALGNRIIWDMEQYKAVQDYVYGLPVYERSIILMNLDLGLSYHEIGELLDKPTQFISNINTQVFEMCVQLSH